MPRGKPSRWDSLEKSLVRLIQHEGADRGHPWNVNLLLWVLKQFSRAFKAIVKMRMAFYELGILRRFPLGCQVISVGNITAGGTGKTPVVEIFARELTAAGRKVAILSRGYRKKELPWWKRIGQPLTPPRVVSDGRDVLLDSEMSGDEPFMLARNLPGVVVLVDKDRVKSGRYAIRHFACDTLILDDGFQYQKLQHQCDVVLVDRTNPFSNGHMLPRGVLREPMESLARADYIFITKCDGSSTDALRARIRKINATAEITECCHKPRVLRDVYTYAEKPLSALKGMKVCALSGIASPAGFEASLRSLGATVLSCERFVDHHRYTRGEILDVLHKAEELGADAVITTEKDAVRLPRIERPPVPMYFQRIDIDILRGAENFEQCVAHICFRKPLGGVQTFMSAR